MMIRISIVDLPFFRISSRLGGSYTFLPAVKQHKPPVVQYSQLIETSCLDNFLPYGIIAVWVEEGGFRGIVTRPLRADEEFVPAVCRVVHRSGVRLYLGRPNKSNRS